MQIVRVSEDIMAFLLLMKYIFVVSKPRKYPHRPSPWVLEAILGGKPSPYMPFFADRHRKVSVSEHCLSIVIYFIVFLEWMFGVW